MARESAPQVKGLDANADGPSSSPGTDPVRRRDPTPVSCPLISTQLGLGSWSPEGQKPALGSADTGCQPPLVLAVVFYHAH